MKNKVLTLGLFILSTEALAYKATFKTWKNSYDLDVVMLDRSFSPDSVSMGQAHGKGWTWFDEKLNKVVNVFPIDKNLYLKITSTIEDMKSIALELQNNPSWLLLTSKSKFHWIEDKKKCNYTSYVLKHEKKLLSDGYKPLGNKRLQEMNMWQQTFVNDKNSLSVTITKDKEFCKRNILFTENNY